MRHLWLSMLLGSSTIVMAATTERSAATKDKISDKLRLQLETAEPDAKHDVVLLLKGQADLSGMLLVTDPAVRRKAVHASVLKTHQKSRKAIVNELSSQARSWRALYAANALVIDGATSSEIHAWASRHDIARIISNRPFRAIAPRANQSLASEAAPAGVGENIRYTGADRVWSELGKNGAGLVIAGNDTGIEWTHPALRAKYRGTSESGVSHDYNWHDAVHQALAPGLSNSCGYDTSEPCDDNGHGTHTLGTTLGDDGQGNQIGMAPGARWIGCRNMEDGIGKPSTYMECFQFFLAPWPISGNAETDGQPDLAPHVINNSWGCPADEGCEGQEFLPMLQTLKAAGIMVVAAAGNAGSACSTIEDSPAHHSAEVLVVGALDHRTSSIASFSSRGPSRFDGATSPDLSAPGVNVRSSVPGGGYQGSYWSGTSMASPHVAGAVALLWSARPEYLGEIEATTALFNTSATARTSTQTCGGVAGSEIPNNTFGHGSLDIYKAVTTCPGCD